MSDKERLEEVKNDIGYLSNGKYSIRPTDYEWLIEQAERVQELDKENKRYREGIKLAMKKTDCDNTWDFLGRLLEGKEETELPYRIGYEEEYE